MTREQVDLINQLIMVRVNQVFLEIVDQMYQSQSIADKYQANSKAFEIMDKLVTDNERK